MLCVSVGCVCEAGEVKFYMHKKKRKEEEEQQKKNEWIMREC